MADPTPDAPSEPHPQQPEAADATPPREIAMMMAHHAELQAQLDQRTAALADAVSGGGDAEAARTALTGFLHGEVIPHALAEEDAVYRAGSAVPALAPLVAGMIMEHQTLLGLAAEIDDGAAGPASVQAAAAFRALFQVHVRKENDLLLPALIDAGSDPAELLGTMHDAFAARRRDAAGPATGEPTTAPGSAPGTEDGLRVADGETLVDTRLPSTSSCDMLANEAVDGLADGASFVLVADHDPRGIKYMLQAERPGSTTWEVLEDGPTRWQVRISRPVAVAPA